MKFEVQGTVCLPMISYFGQVPYSASSAELEVLLSPLRGSSPIFKQHHGLAPVANSTEPLRGILKD